MSGQLGDYHSSSNSFVVNWCFNRLNATIVKILTSPWTDHFFLLNSTLFLNIMSHLSPVRPLRSTGHRVLGPLAKFKTILCIFNGFKKPTWSYKIFSDELACESTSDSRSTYINFIGESLLGFNLLKFSYLLQRYFKKINRIYVWWTCRPSFDL